MRQRGTPVHWAKYNTQVFYHARIILKPERAKEAARIAFEADMTREDLIAKVARPFVEGQQFFCGGVVIHAERVQEVKFNRTNQSSRELLPFIRARRQSSSVVSFSPDEWDVIWEGEDVTRTVLDDVKDTRMDVAAKADTRNDRIFVVHGHDDRAVDQTELLIRRFGLTPIILRDAPSEGRTVIEKFEAHCDVGCAIVLLTPDDIGGVDAEHLSPRARQNVIWEWGHLVARLGRKNVICLYKTGVEMPSDLHGLVTIHVSDDVREKAAEIRRELEAAGYQIP
ncbi:MAG: nucleotide-binding protein [Acidobacteria bacterium]|nr:nucleotide-binding protein [Acidobacteriota bacterium]